MTHDLERDERWVTGMRCPIDGTTSFGRFDGVWDWFTHHWSLHRAGELHQALDDADAGDGWKGYWPR